MENNLTQNTATSETKDASSSATNRPFYNRPIRIPRFLKLFLSLIFLVVGSILLLPGVFMITSTIVCIIEGSSCWGLLFIPYIVFLGPIGFGLLFLGSHIIKEDIEEKITTGILLILFLLAVALSIWHFIDKAIN